LADRTIAEVRQEARRLSKDAAAMLARRGGRLPQSAKTSIQTRIDDLARAIGQDVEPKRLESAMGDLRTELDRHPILRKATIRESVQSLVLALGLALLIRAFLVEAFKIPTGSMIPTLQIDDHIFVNKFVYGLRIPFTHVRMVELGTPERGDIVVFEFPGEGDDRGKDFIKRVVAVAGDRVRLQGNRLVVNGAEVETDVFERGVSCADATFAGCTCDRQRERAGDHEYLTQHLTPGDARSGGCGNNADWPSDNPLQYGGRASNPAYPEMVVPDGHVFCMGDNRDNSSDGRYWGFVPVENIKGKALFLWWPPGRWFRAVH
jgi:signal peptidase I